MRNVEIAVGQGHVLKCKMVSEDDYQKMKLESEKAQEQKDIELYDMQQLIHELQVKVRLLESDIRKLKGEE